MKDRLDELMLLDDLHVFGNNRLYWKNLTRITFALIWMYQRITPKDLKDGVESEVKTGPTPALLRYLLTG